MHRNVSNEPGDGSDGRAPTEAWLFAQAVLGKPIPKIVRPEVLARAKRAELEEWAPFSSRHAEELRSLQSAEAEAAHDRELLEFRAQISTKAADELRALQRQEAEEREAWRRAEQFVEMLQEGKPGAGLPPGAPGETPPALARNSPVAGSRCHVTPRSSCWGFFDCFVRCDCASVGNTAIDSAASTTKRERK